MIACTIWCSSCTQRQHWRPIAPYHPTVASACRTFSQPAALMCHTRITPRRATHHITSAQSSMHYQRPSGSWLCLKFVLTSPSMRCQAAWLKAAPQHAAQQQPAAVFEPGESKATRTNMRPCSHLTPCCCHGETPRLLRRISAERQMQPTPSIAFSALLNCVSSQYC